MPPDAKKQDPPVHWSAAGDDMFLQVLTKWSGPFFGKSPEQRYWLARAFIKKCFDDYRKGRSAGSPKVACKANNCFGCCLHQKEIDTSPYEVQTIVDRLVQEDRLAPVVARAEKLASHGKGGACPLLGRNGKCTVYDIRPLACASYHSTDSKACKGGPKAKIDKVGELFAATAMVVALGFHPVETFIHNLPKPRHYLFKMLAELGRERLETKEAA